MTYVVRANINGRRIESDPFTYKGIAQKYADDTNKHYKGANARVAKSNREVRR